MNALARYELGELLGRGGMGEVYRAFDTALDRPVAIKLLRTESADDRARLLREARAAAAITHPNAVVIYDVASPDDDPAFIVMELLHGRTLADYIASNEGTTLVKLRWLREVASALATAHARGLVHRDIKPSNVLVCDDGTAKVLDFGIAKKAGLQAMSPTDNAPPFDTAGVAGTPAYMAPEQIAGLIDARSDQFSWAVTAHELLAGRRPAQGIGLPVDVPPRVTAAIARALHDDRSERWPSMRDLVRELDSALAPPPTRSRRRWPWIVAATAVLGIAAVVIVARPRPRGPIDVTTARCVLADPAPIANVPAAATIDVAVCGDSVVATASAATGARHAVARLGDALTLEVPTGRAANAPGAMATCDRGEARVVYWRNDPAMPLDAMPFVIGIVKPFDDPCTDPNRFCDRDYRLGPQIDCTLVPDVPIATSMVACLSADPTSAAIGIAQIGAGVGVSDTKLSATRPARIAGVTTAMDEAAVLVVRDGRSIRLDWILLAGRQRYATLHDGEVGEPGIVALGRDALVVWPERAGDRWVLRAATVAANRESSIDVLTGDPSTTTDAPSLVRVAGGIAIAWHDGDAWKLGVGPDLAAAIAHAEVVAHGVHDTKLAADGDAIVASYRDEHGATVARVDCR